ncbi:TRAP transporter small permease [Roseomonas sp. HF4]|uniref:TRAP transporter small permease n=1 Tax=Roseomonas sp. HF4 TaxID=2562313 RepID=UPI001F1036C2|nr:TRAP transporter small permease [Roseomonas sp. HF4]
MNAELDPAAAQPDPRTRVPLTLERVLLAAAMGAMALITAANVAARYLTDVSIAFTEEYSVVLMVIVTLVGSALAMAAGRHIRVDYFTGMMPRGAQRGAEVVSLLLAILCFGLLAWYGMWLAWDEYRFEVLSNGLGHPNWWYTGWLPLLSLLVIARAAGRLVRILRGEPG